MVKIQKSPKNPSCSRHCKSGPRNRRRHRGKSPTALRTALPSFFLRNILSYVFWLRYRNQRPRHRLRHDQLRSRSSLLSQCRCAWLRWRLRCSYFHCLWSRCRSLGLDTTLGTASFPSRLLFNLPGRRCRKDGPRQSLRQRPCASLRLRRWLRQGHDRGGTLFFLGFSSPLALVPTVWVPALASTLLQWLHLVVSWLLVLAHFFAPLPLLFKS